MDNEDIKILILEKLFNDTIPKIIISDRIFNPDKNDWSFFRNDEDEGKNIITALAFSVSLDNSGNFKSCNIIKHQHVRMRHNNRRLALLAGAMLLNNDAEPLGVELENSSEEFKDKNLAIKKLCKNMGLKFIMVLGQSATKELERINSADGMHVGTIKNILNLSENLDITNLETRKVLLEKLK